MSTYQDFIQQCREEDIDFLDLKAVDLSGKLHHLTIPVDSIDESVLKEGVGFDGSSYGFAKTENSDMVLIPDLSTAVLDPFRDANVMSVMCGIHLADADRTPYSDDVRNICSKAEDLLREEGIADSTMMAPEFEFNIFDQAEYDLKPEESYFMVMPRNAGPGNAYHACNPDDHFADFRDNVVQILNNLGIDVRYHHHEVGNFGQQEIECTFNPILTTGDNSMMVRYVLRNMAHLEELALTLMPKPVFGQAGNGWHVHQYLTRNGTDVFYDASGYANLSQTAMYYVGGMLRHGPAIMAFTNPSTNSYKRLVPGFEAPVALTFGQANRAGALRIPRYVTDPNKVRVEYRPPDATSNPYLCLAAMLMAGIDGIINKIDPTEAGYGPYDSDASKDPELAAKVDFLPRTLYEALSALEADHQFLMRGNVFTKTLIDRWLEMKREEVRQYLLRPHPYEYMLYFDA